MSENETIRTIHPIEEGALARTTTDIIRDKGGERERRYPKGHEFVVEDYVSAEDSEDGVPFYWGSTHKSGNMNDVVVEARHVELVKSEAVMSARTLPSAKAIAEYLGSESLGGFGGKGFTFNEADYSAGDGTLELYGSTDDGLPVGVTVKVIRIVQVDF